MGLFTEQSVISDTIMNDVECLGNGCQTEKRVNATRSFVASATHAPALELWEGTDIATS